MEYVNFLDVCTDVTKTTMKIPQSLYLKEGKYPIFDQGKEYIGGDTNETNVSSDYPYILFGDHTRILKYINQECFIGADGVKLLKVHNPKFIDKYIYYYLITNPILSQGYSRHYKFLKETKFKYVDLEKQQKIVDEIDYIYRKIDLCKEQIVNLETIVKSQFIEMFGDCKKDTSIGEVTSEIKRGQWGEEPLSDGHNYKVIKTNNMEYDGTLELENVVVRNIKKEKFEKNKLEWGDILVEKCGGTKTHSVGYSCLFLEYDDFVANNFIMILTPNKQKINPYFLQYQLRYMYEVQDFADCFNKTTGIQNLKVDIYKNKKICIPNIELQNKFASFVQQIDKSKYIKYHVNVQIAFYFYIILKYVIIEV